jgi:hypothetical protein
MIKKLAAAAVVLLASASPASALTFVRTPGSPVSFAAPAGGTTVDFNGALPSGFTLTGGQLVTGDNANVFAEPAFSDGSRYLAVLAGQTATLTAPNGFTGVSLFLGSVDSFNTLDVLSTAGAVLGSFTGSQLVNNPTGNQNAANTNLRVSFFNTPGEANIGGLRFSSGQNAFETDNIAFLGAVPEPATWAMMLLGFGAVGYSMRRSKKARQVTFAI